MEADKKKFFTDATKLKIVCLMHRNRKDEIIKQNEKQFSKSVKQLKKQKQKGI